MELKIQTIAGELTAVIESYPINCYQDIYIGTFKEKPRVVVQADSVSEAIDELHISLKVWLRYEQECY